MIYAYVIREAGAAAVAPSCRGFGGAAVRALQCDGLSALYSRHRSLRVRPTPESVRIHERVVEAAMTGGTVLPLRFGTQLEGEGELEAALDERRDELLRGLDRVRGCVELGLRVLPRDAGRGRGSRPRSSGREYLLGRVADQRDRQQAAQELHGPLARLAEASVVRRPAPPATLVASYLVARDMVDEFRACADQLSQRQPDCRVMVTGPWPPYSFVPERER
jgi:hypothetical protein